MNTEPMDMGYGGLTMQLFFYKCASLLYYCDFAHAAPEESCAY